MAEKKKQALSAFTIIMIIIIGLALITWIPMKGVTPAKISDVFMSPFNGFKSAIDVCAFVLFLGGFLGIVTKTGALDAGIAALVNKLKGKEIVLIPILMFLFSLGGTTYGMAEETIAFYSLICGTMVAAGFDTIVATAVILVGSGVGVLGSTVNPFATGVAISTVKDLGIPVNNSKVMILGLILWLSSYALALWYVLEYATKIKKDKGSMFLSQQEKDHMQKEFAHIKLDDNKFTGKHKITLIIFVFTFIVMILSLIAWGEYNIKVFDGWTSYLTGVPFGQWYFGELACWFLFMGIVIGIINRFSEKEIVDTFIAGSADMLAVVLIIGLSRGVAVVMGATGFDKFLLDNAVNLLKGLPGYVFAPAAYIVYMGLTFLIPSTSGLAGATMPVMGPLAQGLGFSVEVIIMIFCAASGLVNLITPTSAVVMGGIQSAGVKYTTYIKWITKFFVMLFVLNIIILTVAIMVI